MKKLGEVVEYIQDIKNNKEAQEFAKKVVSGLAKGVAIVGAGAVGLVEGGPIAAAVSAAVAAAGVGLESISKNLEENEMGA